MLRRPNEPIVRIIALILCSCLVIIPASSLAQAPALSTVPAQFTYVLQGKTAPFTGYLFSPDAVIKLTTDSEFKIKRLQLDQEYALQKQQATYQLKLDTLQISYDMLMKQTGEIDKIKDEEIQKLRKIVEKSNSSNPWIWFAAGVGTGIVVTVVLYFVISEVKK